MVSRKGKICGSLSLLVESPGLSICDLSHPFCIIKSVSGGHLLLLTGHMLDFIGCSHCLRSPFGVRSDGGSKPTGVEE